MRFSNFEQAGAAGTVSPNALGESLSSGLPPQAFPHPTKIS
jgi:hypothetical protein